MKTTQIIHFIILLLILAIGVGMFFSASGSRTQQFTIGSATAVAYVMWGLLHQAQEQDLHQKVVVEYILIGAIAIILLYTVLGF